MYIYIYIYIYLFRFGGKSGHKLTDQGLGDSHDLEVCKGDF